MSEPNTASHARTLTLVFTDLAGSTALKTELGDHAVSGLIGRHRALVERLAARHGGRIIDWAGDGCFLTFETSSPAVLFGLTLQQAHAVERDLPGVRVGVHIGEVTETAGTAAPRVEGLAVDLAARISSLAQPLQVLMSSAVFNSVRQRLRGDDLGATIVWLAHGAYELKGFDDPLEICEAGIDGVSPLAPPSGSEKAHRAVTPTEEDTLGWRPAVGLPVPRREHWILEDRLGEGGYGEVWLAIHAKTKAKRVFKFCYEPERVRGLKREVVLFRLLKESLGHRDDIAQIVDWEFERAPYFLESEYTEGGDLRDWSGRHGGLDRIPLSTRLEIVAQVGVALGAAHSVGVLHKDIKPANILISEVAGKGTPRASLTDFGIGLITDMGALAAQGITSAGLTQTLVRSSSSDSGSGAGTRLYMAPEIVEGKAGTTLSDIYSLGVVLYQMVIGDLARGIAPGWERGVDDELLREDIGLCIDGDPARRLKSADQLAERLRGLTARREALRKRRAGARRRRLLVGSTVVGPIVTLLILGFAFQQTRLVDEANRQKELAEAASERAGESAAAAEAARAEAERQRNEAVVLRAEAEQGQYVASTRLAATMLEQGNVVSAQSILKTMPAAYRDWEWGYLVNRAWPPVGKQETGIPEAPAGKTAAEIWFDAAPRLVSTLVGHSSRVSSAIFHPDGSRIITVSLDRTFRVWDIATAKELLRVPLPPASLDYVGSIDPAGRILATIHGTGPLALWDLNTGALVRELTGHTNSAAPHTFNANGTKLVSAGLDRMYVVWDVATGSRLAALEVPLPAVMEFVPDAVFLADSTRLMVTFPDNEVVEWDYAENSIIRRIRGRKAESFGVGRFSPDGGFVASWSPELNSMMTWSTETGDEHRSGSFGVSALNNPMIYSPDGSMLVYRGEELVWKLFVQGNQTDTHPIRTTALTGFYPGAVNQPGTLIALPDADGSVRIYAPASQSAAPEDVAQQHDDAAYVARYSPNGALLVSAGFDGTVALMNSDTLEPIRKFKAHQGEITTVVFSPDGRYLNTFGYDDFARVWDVASGEMLLETRGNLPATFAGGVRGPAVRVSSNLLGDWRAFSADGSRVLFATGRGEITLKRVPSGEVERVFRNEQEWSYKNGFSPDGRFVLNLPYQETFITLFDAETGAIVAELRGHEGQIVDRRFSPDGSRIVTTSSDGTARLWDGATGESIDVIKGEGGGVFTADFSPDGTLLGLGNVDGSAGVYRVDSGEKVASFSGHAGLVNGVAFSPDGLRVLTSSLDNVSRVWDLRGNLLTELRLDTGEQLYSIGWSPDGRGIVTTSGAGKVRVWRAVDWTGFGDPLATEEDFETQLARVRGK